MAKPKEQKSALKDFLLQEHERITALPIKDERWFVTETGRRWYDAEWGTWQGGKTEIVSPYFKTEADVDAWLEKYEPDDGGVFKKNHQYLREHKVCKWSNT